MTTRRLLPLLLFALTPLLLLPAQDVVFAEAQDLQFAAALNLFLPVTVDYDVQNYKIRYSTVDAFGRPDTASGLLTIPQNRELAFPLAVYNHGTVGDREEVPSRSGVTERTLPIIIGASGYITLSPDYIGLGDSPGIHPYVHAASEAGAGRDMIIAVKKWLAEEGIAQNEQLFITGYSQGGHAAQALHRELETQPVEGIEVTSATHLSGPYSISDVMVNTVFSEELATLPGYIAYTYVSYNYVYGLYEDLGEVFLPPYLGITQQFADETLSLDEYNTRLTTLLADNDAMLADIFQDSIRQALESGDPANPINIATADNDTYDWAPTAPTLIYYCTRDEQVPNRNAILADSVMRANGSTALTLESGGALTHTGCVQPAMRRTLEFWEPLQMIVTSLGEPVARPELRVAPNPVRAGDELRLMGFRDGALPYALYDATGRVAAGGILTESGVVSLPGHLARGLHVLRVGLLDGTSVVRKIIVE